MRPISVTTELAAMHDGLILQRYRHLLESSWGPNQCGGVHETLASVLAVLLLCQSRLAAGLVTYLAFADLFAAFDVASRVIMLLEAFDAGVTGGAWLILDDLFCNDHCRVRIDSVITELFQLAGGTAQGRRLSVHLFNGLMRRLHCTIAGHSRGAGVWRNRWPGTARQLADAAQPPCPGPYSPTAAQHTGSRIVEADGPISAARTLATVAVDAVRRAAIDEVAPFRIFDMQIVDVLVAFASSVS